MADGEKLSVGRYEELVSARLLRRIEATADLYSEYPNVIAAEVPDRVAMHLSRAIERALASFPDDDRASRAVSTVEAVLTALDELGLRGSFSDEHLVAPARMLRLVTTRQPDGSARSIQQPLTPLLDTTLLTNAPGEPRIQSQVITEFDSAQRVDLLMAFIRMSGITPILGAITAHRHANRPLRILTTTYTNSTEKRALDALADLGAEIKISYDESSTRLHAKAWLFRRPAGYSTAYIGSSNLTFSAQQTGLEWNVRLSGIRNPGVVEKVSAVFESYWNSPDFVAYDPTEFEQRTQRTSSGPMVYLSPIEISPTAFQSRMLEEIAVSREQGRHRNLLVSATGTGKTVMAAIDYTTLRRARTCDRLLFIAHRQEILDKSQATFGMRSVTTHSASNGSVAAGQPSSTMCLLRCKALRPWILPICRPTTSTW